MGRLRASHGRASAGVILSCFRWNATSGQDGYSAQGKGRVLGVNRVDRAGPGRARGGTANGRQGDGGVWVWGEMGPGRSPGMTPSRSRRMTPLRKQGIGGREAIVVLRAARRAAVRPVRRSPGLSGYAACYARARPTSWKPPLARLSGSQRCHGRRPCPALAGRPQTSPLSASRSRGGSTRSLVRGVIWRAPRVACPPSRATRHVPKLGRTRCLSTSREAYGARRSRACLSGSCSRASMGGLSWQAAGGLFSIAPGRWRGGFGPGRGRRTRWRGRRRTVRLGFEAGDEHGLEVGQGGDDGNRYAAPASVLRSTERAKVGALRPRPRDEAVQTGESSPRHRPAGTADVVPRALADLRGLNAIFFASPVHIPSRVGRTEGHSALRLEFGRRVGVPRHDHSYVPVRLHDLVRSP